MKKLFFFAFAAFAFAACSDESESTSTPPPGNVCVSFESKECLTDPDGKIVTLGDAEIVYGGVLSYTPKNIFWPKPLAFAAGQTDDFDQIFWQGPYIFTADGLLSLGAYYDDGTLWDTETGEKISDTWGGFVLSQNSDKTATNDDVGNQFSVWADGGANSTATFAVGYDSNTAGAGFMPEKDYNSPQIDFAHEVLPRQISLANSSYTYPFFKGLETDSYIVRITGWIGNVEGKSVDCELIKGASKVAGWINVNLSSLGSVNKLTFKVLSSENYAPMYFCIDEIYFDE